VAPTARQFGHFVYELYNLSADELRTIEEGTVTC
jgi:hypothetical protein